MIFMELRAGIPEVLLRSAADVGPEKAETLNEIIAGGTSSTAG